MRKAQGQAPGLDTQSEIVTTLAFQEYIQVQIYLDSVHIYSKVEEKALE